jgi:hypothetical protein
LVWTEKLAESLPAFELTTDSAPDMITITLSGLTSLIDRHGRSSEHVVAAVHVLDRVVPTLMAALRKSYNGRAVSELVLMGSHPSFVETVDTRELMATIHRLLPSVSTRSSPCLTVCH